MEECGSVSADCAGVLVRTCRISGSDLSLDTVLYKRETLANATVDPTRRCAGVGSGAIVCYSGLQDTFGKERDGVLANHVQHILRPLSALFPNNTYIAFDTVDRELLPVVMNTLMDEVHIHPSHVISEPREYSDDRRMTLRGQTRAVMQKQFMGIEHCGQLIAKVQVARGVDFAFALRLRYDILFSHELRLRDWPIWNMGDEHTAPVLALSKYVTYNLTQGGLHLDGCPWQLPARRCVPQDVFFVVRNTACSGTVDRIFRVAHDRPLRFSYPAMRRKNDSPERAMFDHPIRMGLPIDVVWNNHGRCLWKISHPRALFLRRTCGWPARTEKNEISSYLHENQESISTSKTSCHASDIP